MKRRTWTALGILLIALALLFTGCGGDDDSEKDAATSRLDEIVKRGTLKVGMSTFKPWAMQSKTGDLIGFEIDVATRLAEDMGVEVEFVPTKWSGIIPALLTGKFDVIIGGMGIRPDRNLTVNFSIPYDNSGMSLVAHREKAPGFTSLAEFNKSGIVIAARIGTTAADAAKKFMPDAELRLFDDESQAFQELLNGNAAAVVASAPTPAFYAVENSDILYLPVSGTFTYEPIGFALPKGDVDLLNFFNSWIRIVDAEGWLAERKQYWFETQDWASQIE